VNSRNVYNAKIKFNHSKCLPAHPLSENSCYLVGSQAAVAGPSHFSFLN
jgi:hypothetical protein